VGERMRETSITAVEEFTETYEALKYQELFFRKYPNTILTVRIQEKYPEKLREIITTGEKILLSLNNENLKDAKQNLESYKKKIAAYGLIFEEEQIELDKIHMITRDVTDLSREVESQIKSVPKLTKTSEVSDADKKINKLTATKLSNIRKETNALVALRYKIDLTLVDALAIAEQVKSLREALIKLMNAYAKKNEKYFTTLALFYKKVRAKARVKAKLASKGKKKLKKSPRKVALAASAAKLFARKNKTAALESTTTAIAIIAEYVTPLKKASKP
jgi:hypothetical protein